MRLFSITCHNYLNLKTEPIILCYCVYSFCRVQFDCFVDRSGKYSTHHYFGDQHVCTSLLFTMAELAGAEQWRWLPGHWWVRYKFAILALFIVDPAKHVLYVCLFVISHEVLMYVSLPVNLLIVNYWTNPNWRNNEWICTWNMQSIQLNSFIHSHSKWIATQCQQNQNN